MALATIPRPSSAQVAPAAVRIGRGTFSVTSRSNPTQAHVVSQLGDALTCTCPAAGAGHRPDCAHRDAVRLLLDSEERAKERKPVENVGHIDRKFVIERQGREMVLYAGLLDLAHRQEELSGVYTTLVQVPSQDNGQVAIVTARVETRRGTFCGIGDAGPSNVAKAMVTATIRMAETRAKARALRDAVNVGALSIEELADDDEPTPTPTSRPQPPRPAPRPTEPTPINAAAAPPLAMGAPADEPTATQLRAIEHIAHEKKLHPTDIDLALAKRWHVRREEMTRAIAAELIQTLQAGKL